jgi:hypothetical protein
MIARVLWALVLVLLLASVVALYRGERVRDEIDTGPSAAALRDPLLASRRFLEANGRTTRSLEVLGTAMELPPRDGALLFLGSRLGLSDPATAALDGWVRAGGHLVTLPSSISDEMLYGRHDELLGRHGVFPSSPAEEGQDEYPMTPPDDAPVFDRDGCLVSPLLTARLPAHLSGTPERLVIGTPVQARLSVARTGVGEVLAEDALGPFIYTVPHGRGRVTVLADADIWTNTDVGCVDHAHLLLRLVGDAPAVWVVTHAERPTLFTLLLREGVPLLLSGALLLALWLWLAGARFGPRLPSPVPVRRERAEAVRAAGEYLWRQRAVHDLLAGVRARVRTAARRRFGSEDAIAALAARARVAADRGEGAMREDPRHERDFIATTRTLKELIEQS